MFDMNMLKKPLFFASNRVWRCYLGGKLLDQFIGNDNAVDANFPEDWLASVTRADNGEQQQLPDEGLSLIRGTKTLFADLLKNFPTEALGPDNADGLGVLCKFLDSAIRLPIQCHPDREFSRKHFNCEHGKTESWLILSTREINGEPPYILLGFKPEVTPEQFRRAVMAQDIPAMMACLHKFPVLPGEVYFIPGRIPHAIGPGLMLLEVQEPTDLVIQPERQIEKITLTEQQMWAGLEHDTAFSCFDYCGQTPEELLVRLKLCPKLSLCGKSSRLESLIGSVHTDCFTVDRLTVQGEHDLELDAPWYLGIVTSGQGMVCGIDEQPLRRGDSFFVSHQISSLSYKNTGTASLEIHLISRGKK